MNKLTSTITFFLFFQFAIAQTTTTNYWIRFKGKKDSPFSINAPSAYLSQRAIDRRTRQHIAIVSNDLPVNPDYINEIKSFGIKIINQSKWFNAVTVACTDAGSIDKIRALSFVKDVTIIPIAAEQKVSSKFKTESNTMAVPMERSVVSTATNVFNYGPAQDQAHQINIDCMHNMGYQGQGMIIAYLDAGFYKVDSLPIFDSMRVNGQILGTRDFVNGGTFVYDDINTAHGMCTLSCTGGNLPGRIVGTAPKAKFWLFRTENVYSESWQEEINWSLAAEFADSVGADIITSSLGYSIGMTSTAQDHTYPQMDGNTTIVTNAADFAAGKGIFVVSAAGNAAGPPWYKITAPGDADSVLTVGAVDSAGFVASFSSRGPTYDGRIKPNTVAKGVQAIVASPYGDIVGENGTSFSTPITAGAVACLWQANPLKTNMELLDAIQQSANQHLTPDTLKGYGTPNFCLANYLLTGIDEHQTVDEKLTVYPNPFNMNFEISFYSDKKQIVQFELFDIAGRKLFSQEKNVDANSNNLFNSADIGVLSNGVYVLRLMTPGKTYFKKLIKE